MTNEEIWNIVLGEMKVTVTPANFATWFKDYQTYARRLSEEEIREALDYGVDMFLNLDHFIPA